MRVRSLREAATALLIHRVEALWLLTRLHPLQVDKQPNLTLEQVNAQLLTTIQSCNTTLTGKMEEIKVDIGLLRQDMQNIKDWMAETEHRISFSTEERSWVPHLLCYTHFSSDPSPGLFSGMCWSSSQLKTVLLINTCGKSVNSFPYRCGCKL